jgi:hypothetical protein
MKQLWVRLVSNSGFTTNVSVIKHYHYDNGIFSEEMFWRNSKEWQSQSFSSVSAQHQNAHAERAI